MKKARKNVADNRMNDLIASAFSVVSLPRKILVKTSQRPDLSGSFGIPKDYYSNKAKKSV